MGNQLLMVRSCPNCGAPVEFIPRSTCIVCAYCRSPLYADDGLSLKKDNSELEDSSSLSDMYEHALETEVRNRRISADAEEKLSALERYGFNIANLDSFRRMYPEPMYLDDESLDLAREAASLIKPEKWEKARTYSKEDLIVKHLKKPDKYTYIGLPESVSFAKWRWPDGTIHVFMNKFPGTEWFKKGVLAEKAEIRTRGQNLLDAANAFEAIDPLLWGEQQYVVFLYKNNVDSAKGVVLFRDGYMFDPSGDFTGSNAYYSSNGYGLYHGGAISLSKDWLLGNIRGINDSDTPPIMRGKTPTSPGQRWLLFQ